MRIFSLLLTAFLICVQALAQGSLTPPGPPGPTMKSLGEIEPRINVQRAINPLPTNSTYAIVIDTPGSYYLSANLSVTRPSGISITASHVALDLNGFMISRASGSGGDGINIAAGLDGCVVRNGSVRGFANGIYDSSNGAALRDLAVSACFNYGIHSGIGAVIENCRGTGNNAIRCIWALKGSSVSHCTLTGNTCTFGFYGEDGVTFANCSASSNIVQYGFYANAGTVLQNCTAAGNTWASIPSAGIASGGMVIACSANNNTNTSAVVTNRAGMGIYAVGTQLHVRNCTVSQNKGDGIFLVSNGLARENLCNENGNGGTGAGIRAFGTSNLIEGNHVTNNDIGIAVDAAQNLIIRNVARLNTSNFELSGGNSVGLIVEPRGSPAITGNGPGEGIGATEPWTNFAF